MLFIINAVFFLKNRKGIKKSESVIKNKPIIIYKFESLFIIMAAKNKIGVIHSNAKNP